MFDRNIRRFVLTFAAISLSLVIFQSSQSFGAKQTWKYMGNAGCKCHMSKGCFEGEEYKKMKNQHYNAFQRLETDEDKSNPECLKCHATAFGMKIKKGKSKQGSKDFIEDVGCEACHGPGEGYIDVKKNYEGKGKDAFKALLQSDPMAARKAQYDAGLEVAGINKYETIKEQCLNCHWEDAGAKNKCPKCEGKKNSEGQDRLFTKDYIKRDDHRDHDAIDDVLAKMSDADKKKWKGYIEQDPWYKTKPPNAK
ncbi:MAG: cytochrome c family protein [Candidatus Scalindua sp.]|nr:cytochrome c family protein [Candidatus Scalindua sp.]MCR4344298.1 cytochrome c family protein [Candidatus Scalindua sp.]